METVEDIICPGCGLATAPFDGPVHHYMTSSPYCWNLFGKILAREYQDPSYMVHHRLSVDAFALQHPGTKNPQAAQSVNIHLLSLHLIFSKEMAIPKVMTFMQAYSNVRKGDAGCFGWLTPPKIRGNLRVNDILTAESSKAHGMIVRNWAQEVYEAWQAHHAVAEQNFLDLVAN